MPPLAAGTSQGRQVLETNRGLCNFARTSMVSCLFPFRFKVLIFPRQLSSHHWLCRSLWFLFSTLPHLFFICNSCGIVIITFLRFLVISVESFYCFICLVLDSSLGDCFHAVDLLCISHALHALCLLSCSMNIG